MRICCPRHDSTAKLSGLFQSQGIWGKVKNMSDKKYTLVKAPVKTEFLNNGAGEKVTYLNLELEKGYYSIREDVKNGAQHFSDIEKLINKKHLSRVVAISADNAENGLMGIAYIEMSELWKKDEAWYISQAELSFAEENKGSWTEQAGKMPVIGIEEIINYYCSSNIPFELDGELYSQAHVNNKKQPYWMSCRREPVCVMVPVKDASGDCMELLDIFSANRHVYVLFLGEEKREDMDELPFCGMTQKQFNALRNNYILSNSCDAANISLLGIDSRPYYKNVFRQNILQRGIKTVRGFSYGRAVALAESVNGKKVCEMIDRIISYALKDVEDTGNVVFENSTFDFVNEFSEETKSCSVNGKNARRLMEENLVGLEEIKQQVYDIVNVMKYNRLRSQMNISGSSFHNVHLMLGAPGTAKTTVATYMGQLMLEEKLLPGNRVICINGAQLKGMFVGHSAPKTRQIFEKNDIIFIDEAYSITEDNGRTDSFGNEAIAQMIIEIENHSTDKLVIFAGYGGKDVADRDNKMKNFIDSNPGIRSRITSTFYFRSYTAEEMGEIFLRLARVGNYTVQDGAADQVVRYFRSRVDAGDFGNGREARALLENSSLFAARRLMESGRKDFEEEELRLLTVEDISNAIARTEELNGNTSRETRRMGFY